MFIFQERNAKGFYFKSWDNILLNLKQFVFLRGILHDMCIIRKITKYQSDRFAGNIPNLFLVYCFSRDTLDLKMSPSKKENYLKWLALQLCLSGNTNPRSLLTGIGASPVASSHEACYSGFWRSNWRICCVALIQALYIQAFGEWCSEVFQKNLHTLGRVSDSK